MSVGRKVAIDASMSIYQFLIAVRQDGSTLTNAEGETTRYDLTVSEDKCGQLCYSVDMCTCTEPMYGNFSCLLG